MGIHHVRIRRFSPANRVRRCTRLLGRAVEGIPTGRGGVGTAGGLPTKRRLETAIHGAVAWAHGDEVIHSFGGNVLCYGRSMMKPSCQNTETRGCSGNEAITASATVTPTASLRRPFSPNPSGRSCSRRWMSR